MSEQMQSTLATAYRTQSKAGDSYAINRFSEAKASPLNTGKTDEELRLMSDWPSDGQLYAADADPGAAGTRTAGVSAALVRGHARRG